MDRLAAGTARLGRHPAQRRPAARGGTGLAPMDTAGLAYPLLAALVLGAAITALALRALGRSRRRELEQTEARLRGSFQELAAGALRDNTDLFLKLARESFGREQADFQGLLRERETALNALLEPLRTALERTEAQASALERERRDAHATLRTQI